LGGKRITLAKAKKMNMPQLLDYVKTKVKKEVYRDIKASAWKGDVKGYQQFKTMIQNIVGRPITTIQSLKTAVRNTWREPRYVCIRALLGGIPPAELYRSKLFSCVETASKVYDESSRTMDAKIVQLYVEAGSTGKKRKRTDNIQISKVERRKGK